MSFHFGARPCIIRASGPRVLRAFFYAVTNMSISFVGESPRSGEWKRSRPGPDNLGKPDRGLLSFLARITTERNRHD
jgi:hypothetical protein